MSKGFKKKILLFLSLVFICTICLAVWLSLLLSNSFEEMKIKTVYGDVFTLSFDNISSKSIIEDPNSRFHLVCNGKISQNDIKGLVSSAELKAYRIKDTVFFDDGNGFEIFDEDTDLKAHAEVVEVVKENLNCDEQFYKRYKKILEKQ